MPADRSGPVRVETPDLVLRAFVGTDVSELLIAFEDEDVARWNPGPKVPDAAHAFIAERNDWSSRNHASWAVAERSGPLIGSVSLHKIDQDQKEAEIGYWIAPWARRRGHAVRAVSAAAEFAFTKLGLHRVYGYHAVQNAGSCAVLAAAGFGHEGTLRQSFRYADGTYHDEHLHARLSSDAATRA